MDSLIKVRGSGREQVGSDLLLPDLVAPNAWNNHVLYGTTIYQSSYADMKSIINHQIMYPGNAGRPNFVLLEIRHF